MQCFFFIFSKQAEGCVLSSLQSQTGSPLQNSSHLFSSESKQRNFPLFLFILFQQPCTLCCVFVAEKCCKVVVDSVVASQHEGCKPPPPHPHHAERSPAVRYVDTLLAAANGLVEGAGAHSPGVAGDSH